MTPNPSLQAMPCTPLTSLESDNVQLLFLESGHSTYRSGGANELFFKPTLYIITQPDQPREIGVIDVDRTLTSVSIVEKSVD